MIEYIKLDDIPDDFDEHRYVIDRPEAAAFKKTFCQIHDIPDRVRIYCHYLTNSVALDYESARLCFLNNDYQGCYEQLVAKLPAVASNKYYPTGYMLVNAAKQLGKQQELVDHLRKMPLNNTINTCLKALDCAVKLDNDRVIVFYAFSSAYFAAFQVAILSLVRNNSSLLERTLFVIGYDGPSEFQDLSEFMSKIDEVNYDLIDMHEYRQLELRETYGTDNGQHLDRSAYYRIFLLQHIYDRYSEHYYKALYLDVDTVVISSLEELLVGTQQNPLMARPEKTTNDLVKKAKALRDIDFYFNSGVLLFDLRHPALQPCLAKTLDVALNQQPTLMFHDQCALNAGFKGFVDALEDRYNFALHGLMCVTSDIDVVILHYTGRLKPWDLSHHEDTVFNRVWRTLHSFLPLAQSPLVDEQD